MNFTAENTYYLNTDGGSRNNPGPAAIGYVLQNQGVELFARYKYLGVATNNEAEYKALISGLRAVIESGQKIQHLVCRLDSQLVVFQITGKYKIKKPELATLAAKVHQLLEILRQRQITVDFEYVPRKQNKRADQLVNLALDKAQSL